MKAKAKQAQKIKLEDWTANDERQTIDHPFSQNGWTFATDGRVMIRVALRSKYAEQARPNIRSKEFPFDHDSRTEDWTPIPSEKYPEAKTKTCYACDGCGSFVQCHNCMKETPVEGGPISCDECGGRGMIVNAKRIQFEHVAVSDIYIRKLQTLTDCEWLLPEDPFGMILFRAPGVLGYLMPMRVG